jgi:hypothetical protein
MESNASRDYSRGLLTPYGGLMSGTSRRGAFLQWQAMSEMSHGTKPLAIDSQQVGLLDDARLEAATNVDRH